MSNIQDKINYSLIYMYSVLCVLILGHNICHASLVVFMIRATADSASATALEFCW